MRDKKREDHNDLSVLKKWFKDLLWYEWRHWICKKLNQVLRTKTQIVAQNVLIYSPITVKAKNYTV